VTYGIDLKELRPGDVLISSGGQRVTIRLPAVKKLGFRVRLAKSRIIDHKGSWYWRKDSSLREAVLKQAEERLAGLERPSARRLAREHAMDVIEEIVRQASSSDVEVRFEESAESPVLDQKEEN